VQNGRVDITGIYKKSLAKSGSGKLHILKGRGILTSKENDRHITIDELIEQLPENFPAAADIIKTDIAIRMIGLGDAVINHYCRMIKKRTKAESVKDVSKLVIETFDIVKGFLRCFAERPVETQEPELDPAIITMADQIANDPRLLRKRIDLVNELGVAGERRNISLNQITIDSRLLSLCNGKPQSLGLKNAGIQGGGKSHALTTTLNLYPATAYHTITSGSAKSFYNMADSIQHKAIIFLKATPWKPAVLRILKFHTWSVPSCPRICRIPAPKTNRRGMGNRNLAHRRTHFLFDDNDTG
jgi:hypothetical protein